MEILTIDLGNPILIYTVKSLVLFSIIMLIIVFILVIKTSNRYSKIKKDMVDKFIKDNPNLTLVEVKKKLLPIYNNLDEKTKRWIPIDSLWETILKNYKLKTKKSC